MRVTLLRWISSMALGLGLAVAPGSARAEVLPEGLEQVLRDVASENLRRLRRSVAFGPHVGASGHYIEGPNRPDAGLSFGLGLYLFRVPFTFELDRTIRERVRGELKAELRRMADEGKTPSGDELKALVRRLYEGARDELLGKEKRLDQTLEDPRFGFVVEGQRMFRSEAWQLRVMPSVGIGPVSLGIGGALHLGDKASFLPGAELSMRLLPEEGPRSKVIELFLRGEAPVVNRVEVGMHLGAGARLLFDVL
jgi:hypothetical protein